MPDERGGLASTPVRTPRARQIASRLSRAASARATSRPGAASRRVVGTPIAAPRTRSTSTRRSRCSPSILFPRTRTSSCRDRMRTTRSVVLLVDVSGSMRGERVSTAAATVGRLVELSHDALSCHRVLVGCRRPAEARGRPSADGAARRHPAHPRQGLANIAFPLGLAQQQLARVPARDARVLLLRTACTTEVRTRVPSRAGSPGWMSSWMPRARRMSSSAASSPAAKGRGVCRIIHGHRDVAPAVSEIFAGR